MQSQTETVFSQNRFRSSEPILNCMFQFIHQQFVIHQIRLLNVHNELGHIFYIKKNRNMQLLYNQTRYIENLLQT